MSVAKCYVFVYYSNVLYVTDMVRLVCNYLYFFFKVLEKCTQNLIGHSRLAFNNHESNIDC